MDTHKNELIIFLKDLTLSLETNNIHPKRLKSLEEFYKIHTFLTSTINNNLYALVETTKFEDEARDFIKFLILAWFMYCISKKSDI